MRGTPWMASGRSRMAATRFVGFSDESGFWNTMRTTRRNSASFVTSAPDCRRRTVTAPEVGASSLSKRRPSVVLPQPLSPTSARTSPPRTSRVTSSSACTGGRASPSHRVRAPGSSKCLVRLRTLATAAAISPEAAPRSRSWRTGGAAIAVSHRRQRAPCAGPTVAIGGCARVHASSTRSQRGAKTQPPGRRVRSGSRPRIGRKARARSMSGRASSSPRV